MKRTSKAAAARIATLVGGMSFPSKMPCASTSTPATSCITGSKLHKVEGSVCADCYARKAFYVMSNVQAAMQRREALIGSPSWIQNMAAAIFAYEDEATGCNGETSKGFFRWHDSGDIQSVEHLEAIAEVCRLTPTIQHWLPTKEFRMVRTWARHNAIPSNLCIRVSAAMVDGKPPVIFDLEGTPLPTATVSTRGDDDCPAYAAEGTPNCGPCRRCWKRDNANTVYPFH